MADLEPIPYSDAKLRSILERVKTIAMVGASPNWNRPSYFVMKYLQGKGYRVIPVNPAMAGKSLLGETAYKSLRDIPEKIDMVDMFRVAEEAPGVVAEAIAIGAKVVWMQLGIRNDQAAATAEAAGIEVVMNPCPKIEFGRLGGELSWSGVNSGIIRNRPPGGAAAAADQAAPGARAEPRLRLRNPRDPCRCRSRSDDRRALNPDLSDDGPCVRRRRSRGLALQSAQFRIHLFAVDKSHRRSARRTARDA
jgi:predicted CoA-binding protein